MSAAKRIYPVEALRVEGAPRLALVARRSGRKLCARSAADSLGWPSMRSAVGRLVAEVTDETSDAAAQDALVCRVRSHSMRLRERL